jgi:hypothetical protein
MIRKYFELGFSPLLIAPREKKPISASWQQWCVALPTDEIIDDWQAIYDISLKTNRYNIGIACGPASGIVALDIDVNDEAILDLCPPSPVRRKGKKGEVRFFKYHESLQKSFPIKGVGDFLSTGRQVLIPPSTHPDGMEYIWLTPDTLENFSKHDLPSLDLSFVDKLNPYKKFINALH